MLVSKNKIIKATLAVLISGGAAISHIGFSVKTHVDAIKMRDYCDYRFVSTKNPSRYENDIRIKTLGLKTQMESFCKKFAQCKTSEKKDEVLKQSFNCINKWLFTRNEEFKKLKHFDSNKGSRRRHIPLFNCVCDVLNKFPYEEKNLDNKVDHTKAKFVIKFICYIVKNNPNFAKRMLHSVPEKSILAPELFLNALFCAKNPSDRKCLIGFICKNKKNFLAIPTTLIFAYEKNVGESRILKTDNNGIFYGLIAMEMKYQESHQKERKKISNVIYDVTNGNEEDIKIFKKRLARKALLCPSNLMNEDITINFLKNHLLLSHEDIHETLESTREMLDKRPTKKQIQKIKNREELKKREELKTRIESIGNRIRAQDLRQREIKSQAFLNNDNSAPYSISSQQSHDTNKKTGQDCSKLIAQAERLSNKVKAFSRLENTIEQQENTSEYEKMDLGYKNILEKIKKLEEKLENYQQISLTL